MILHIFSHIEPAILDIFLAIVATVATVEVEQRSIDHIREAKNNNNNNNFHFSLSNKNKFFFCF